MLGMGARLRQPRREDMFFDSYYDLYTSRGDTETEKVESTHTSSEEGYLCVSCARVTVAPLTGTRHWHVPSITTVTQFALVWSSETCGSGALTL